MIVVVAVVVVTDVVVVIVVIVSAVVTCVSCVALQSSPAILHPGGVQTLCPGCTHIRCFRAPVDCDLQGRTGRRKNPAEPGPGKNTEVYTDRQTDKWTEIYREIHGEWTQRET